MKSIKCWMARSGGSESGNSVGKTSVNSWRKAGQLLAVVAVVLVRTWTAHIGASFLSPLMNWRAETRPRSWDGGLRSTGTVASGSSARVCGT